MADQYVFLVQRDNGYNFACVSSDPAPANALIRYVRDDLYAEPGMAGVWATYDKHTRVTRFQMLPVGSLTEDHLGPGVPVAGVTS